VPYAGHRGQAETSLEPGCGRLELRDSDQDVVELEDYEAELRPMTAFVPRPGSPRACEGEVQRMLGRSA
jgi:hypothetical protein